MKSDIELIVNGKRLDGRGLDDLRPIEIKTGVLHKASGSAYIRWGGNKIVVGVYGPKECLPKHLANPFRAIIKARYMMAPFCSKEGHGRSGPTRRGVEISKLIREVFENVVLTELFPKTQIDIQIEVLQAEGGTRVASLTAVAAALMDAGIPMKEVATGVAVGKVGGKVVMDIGKLEDNYGESDVPMAFGQRTGKILLLQMDGMMTKEEIKEAIEKGWKASKKVYEKQIEAVKENYNELNKKGLTF